MLYKVVLLLNLDNINFSTMFFLYIYVIQGLIKKIFFTKLILNNIFIILDIKIIMHNIIKDVRTFICLF